MRSLRNKVVVLTGASSGFGRGAALRFAEEGASLVLAARRKGLLKEVAEECRARGAKALAVETDVSQREDVERLAEKALDKFGHVDVWVNNAGVATYGEFDKVPLKEHEQVIRTDVLGTMVGSYEAIKHFRERRRGVLINMSSYLGKGSAPFHSSYVAAKHAVRGLGMALRQDLQVEGFDNVHVCTIMPTSHDTPFFDHAGNYTGKPVKPTKPFYDPQQVIETIVRLAVEPEPEVMVGTSAKVASVAGKFMPSLLEKRMAKKVKKEHYSQREEVGDSSGAVMEPMSEGRDVRAGWEQREGGSGAWKWAMLGLVPVAAMAAVKIARSRGDMARAA
ncbi:MAG TPA: SDR family oxidoreductase [Terriglobales bacterium]|nr:SDR family oxidoreductase [Terriglobales bacterium]